MIAALLQDNLPALQVVVPLLGAVLAALVRRGAVAWAITLAVAWSIRYSMPAGGAQPPMA